MTTAPLPSTSSAQEALLSAYRDGFPGSARLAGGQASPIAGGVSHDIWLLAPFAPVFRRAEGARKWDVDGRPVVDFWAGHGALLLGHGPPAVSEAIARQAPAGLHLGGSSDIIHRWGNRVKELVPSIELVRFTSSGTEATLLALRVARAYTGRPFVVRLDGHFHGWHDEATAHQFPAKTSGINAGVEGSVRVASPFDLAAMERLLKARDVAAVFLEPGGGSAGTLPFDIPFLRDLRRLTEETGTLLVFDEVMSGFRYAPGGAQAIAGIRPDLTTLAKVLSGGLPGAAVGGRADVMSVFGEGVQRPHGLARVMHTGTHNGCALAAAAGLATLDLVADGDAQRKAAAAAEEVAASINRAAVEAGVDVRSFARNSIFHIMVGAVSGRLPVEPSAATLSLRKNRPAQHGMLRLALLLEGIDCHGAHGWLGAAHDRPVLDEAAQGFSRAFRRLRGVDGFGLPA
jgi:glutamate-1-semialdehyde 2,1-aminomutase